MFKTAIEQLNDRLDDCIWFSATIIDDLVVYGQTVEPKKWWRAKRYRISKVFFGSKERELFPPDSAYES